MYFSRVPRVADVELLGPGAPRLRRSGLALLAPAQVHQLFVNCLYRWI